MGPDPCLSADSLDAVALRLQHRQQLVAVIALHFDHAVLHRVARAARCLELLTQLDQPGGIQGQPPDKGHGLAAMTLGFATNPPGGRCCNRCLTRLEGRKYTQRPYREAALSDANPSLAGVPDLQPLAARYEAERNLEHS